MHKLKQKGEIAMGADTQSNTYQANQHRDRFLAGMSHAACTVNIITTDGVAGRAGVTVSAMSSVTADSPKPILLVCVHKLSPAASKILENGVFCVNILRDDQSYVSESFAGRFKGQLTDKFDCAEWVQSMTGSWRIVDPLVAFDCTCLSNTLVGTHYVIFGQVEDMFIAERGSPLIYANRAYGSTSRIEPASSILVGQRKSSHKLSLASFHTFGPFMVPPILKQVIEKVGPVELHLIEGDQRRIKESLASGECELALLYDLDLSDDLEGEELTQFVPYVLLPANHPLADQRTIRPQDLADYPMVLLNAPPSRDYFLGMMRDAGVEPRVAWHSTSFEMVRGLVAHGLGYALLGTKPASSMSYDGHALITRSLEITVEPSRVLLAHKKGAQLSPMAKAFLEAALAV